MQTTATLSTIAPLSTADLLVLFNSAADEAYASHKEEQDKAAAQDTFALYMASAAGPIQVQIIEFCGNEVLVSFEDGGEKYVPFSSLEFLD